MLDYDPEAPTGWTYASGTTFGQPAADKPTVEVTNAELSVEAVLTPSLALTFYGSDVGVGTELPLALKASVGAGDALCRSGVELSLQGLLKAHLPFADPADKMLTYLDFEKRLQDLSHLAQWQAACCSGSASSRTSREARGMYEVRDARMRAGWRCVKWCRRNARSGLRRHHPRRRWRNDRARLRHQRSGPAGRPDRQAAEIRGD